MRGGYRPGSGRKSGIKNKATIQSGKRGGVRPGAGRPKGSHDKTPRGTPDRDYSNSEAAKRKAILALGDKAKLKFYQEYMQRVAKGDKLTIAEMKHLDKLKTDLEEAEEKPATPAGESVDPLPYMLSVMNDPKADQETRLRAASLAAPYIHPRKGEGLGKKEEKSDRAKAAGSGKFKASAPPQLKVVGK